MPVPSFGAADFETYATDIVLAVGFVSAVFAGLWRGIKKAKSSEIDPGARIAGGILMDNATMMALTERLRDNTEALYRLGDNMRDLSHQIERARDAIGR